MNHWKKSFAGLATTLLFTVAMPAHAEVSPYPVRPIMIVIPYSAGGGTDQFIRIISKRALDALRKPIAILHQPGGETVLGLTIVSKSDPLRPTTIHHTHNRPQP